MLSLHISSYLTVTRDWEECDPCQIVHKGVTLNLFLLTHCSVHLLMLPSTNFHWSEIISHANVCFLCKQISDVPLNKYLFPCQQIFVALYRRTFLYQLSWSTAPNQIAFQQVSSTTRSSSQQQNKSFSFLGICLATKLWYFTLEVKLIVIFLHLH